MKPILVIASSIYLINTSFNYPIASIYTSILSFRGPYQSRTKDYLPFKQVEVQCLEVPRFFTPHSIQPFSSREFQDQVPYAYDCIYLV